MKKYFQDMIRSHLAKKLKSPSNKGLQMEPLEDRMLLTATPNGWGVLPDSIEDPANELLGRVGNAAYATELVLNVSGADQVYIGLLVSGTDSTPDDGVDDRLDPGAINISKIGETGSFEIIKSISDYNGTADSLLLLKVAASDEGYKVTFEGEGSATVGEFSCCIFTPGDTLNAAGETGGDGYIGAEETQNAFKYITYTNAYLSGNRNPASIDIYRHMFGESVDLSVWNNVYSASYDVNMDGMMTNDDLSLIKLGVTSSQSIVTLQYADKTPPVEEWPEEGATNEGDSPIFSKPQDVEFLLIDKTGVELNDIQVVFGGQTLSGDDDLVLKSNTVDDEGMRRQIIGFKNLGITENGVYEITVTSTDRAGNTSDPVTLQFVYLADSLQEAGTDGTSATEGNSVKLDVGMILAGREDTDGTMTSVTVVDQAPGASDGTDTVIDLAMTRTDWVDNKLTVTTNGAGATVVVTRNDADEVLSVEYFVQSRWEKELNLADAVKSPVKIIVDVDADAGDDVTGFEYGFDAVGVNDAPVAGADVAIGLLDTDASGTGASTVTDRDYDETLAYVTNVTPNVVFQNALGETVDLSSIIPPGTDFSLWLTYDAATGYTFAAPSGETFFQKLPNNYKAILTYACAISDDSDAATTETVVVTITGTNTAPTADTVRATLNLGSAAVDDGVVLDWAGASSDVDFGEAETLVLTAINGNTVTAAAGAPQTIQITDNGINVGQVVVSVDAAGTQTVTFHANQETLKWTLADDENYDVPAISYTVKDAQSVEASGTMNVTVVGAFDALENLTVPDQTVNINATSDDDKVPLDNEIAFSSDDGQNYVFSINSIVSETDPQKTLAAALLGFNTPDYGETGKVTLYADKALLNALTQDDCGDYVVTVAYTNGLAETDANCDAGTRTFKLTVIGYELAFTDIVAGTLTEDTIYDATDATTIAATSLSGNIIVETDETVKNESALTVVSYDVASIQLAGVASSDTDRDLSGYNFGGLMTVVFDETDNGDYKFSFDSLDTFNFLKAGETLTLTYQYKVNNLVLNDGTEDTLYAGTFNGGKMTVTITGVNDAPTGVADHTATIDLASAALVQVDGSGTGLNVLDDVDDPDGDTRTPTIVSVELLAIGYTATSEELSNCFTLATDGTLTVSDLAKLRDIFAALGEDAPLDDAFKLNYKVSDGTVDVTGSVTFSLLGINEAPVWDTEETFVYGPTAGTEYDLTISDLKTAGKLSDVDSETLKFKSFGGTALTAEYQAVDGMNCQAKISSDGQTLTLLFDSIAMKWGDDVPADLEALVVVNDGAADSAAQEFTFNLQSSYDKPELSVPDELSLNTSAAGSTASGISGYVNVGGAEGSETNDCDWSVSEWSINGAAVTETDFNSYFTLVYADRTEGGITFKDGAVSVQFTSDTARALFAAAYLTGETTSVEISFKLTLVDANNADAATNSTSETVTLDVFKKAAPVIDAELIPSGETTNEDTDLTFSLDVAGLVSDAGDIPGTREDGWYEFTGATCSGATINGAAVTALDLAAINKSLSINSDGDLTLAVNAVDGFDFDQLADGETMTLEILFTVKDKYYGVSSTAAVTVTVTGVNDAPITGADVTIAIGQNDLGAANAKSAGSNVTDIDTAALTFESDAPDISFVMADGSELPAKYTDIASIIPVGADFPAWLTYDGATGSYTFTIPAGSTFFQQLPAGVNAVLSYLTTISDGSLSTTETVNVTISGANDAPAILADAPTGSADIAEQSDTAATVINPSDFAKDADYADTLYFASVTVEGKTYTAADSTVEGNEYSWTGNQLTIEFASGATLTLTKDAEGITQASYDVAGRWGKATNLEAGAKASDAISFIIADAAAAVTVSHNYAFNVIGVNDAPVGAADHTVTVDLTDGTVVYDSDTEKTALNLIDGVTDKDGDTQSVTQGVVTISNSYETVFTLSEGAISIAEGGAVTIDTGLLASDFAKLGVGQSEIISVKFTINDSIGASAVEGERTLTITVNGKNEAPTILADASTGSVPITEASGTALTTIYPGAFAEDVDLNNAGFYFGSVTVNGTTVTKDSEGWSADNTMTLTFASGATLKLSKDANGITRADYDVTGRWNQASNLAAGATAKDSIVFTVLDSVGAATGEHDYDFNIVGVNDAPAGVTYHTATVDLAGDGALSNVDGVESATVLNVLTGVSDADGNMLVASINSASATGVDSGALAACFAINNGVLNNGVLSVSDFASLTTLFASLAEDVPATVTISYSVSDGTATVTETITVTVKGKNDAPTASDELSGTVNLADGTQNYSGPNATNATLALTYGATDPDADDTLVGAVTSVTYVEGEMTKKLLADAYTVDGNALTFNIAVLKTIFPYLATTDAPLEFTVNFTVSDRSDSTALSDTATAAITVNGHYIAPSFDTKYDAQTTHYVYGDYEGILEIALSDHFSGSYTAANTSVTLYADADATSPLATLAYTTDWTDISWTDSGNRFLGQYRMTTDEYGNVSILLKSTMYDMTVDASTLYAVITTGDDHTTQVSSNRFSVDLPDDERYTSNIILYGTNTATSGVSTTNYAGLVTNTATLGNLDSEGNYWYYLEIWVRDTSCALTGNSSVALTYISMALDYDTDGNIISVKMYDGEDENIGRRGTAAGIVDNVYYDAASSDKYIYNDGSDETDTTNYLVAFGSGWVNGRTLGSDGSAAYLLYRLKVTVAASTSSGAKTIGAHSISITEVVDGMDLGGIDVGLSYARKGSGSDAKVNISQISGIGSGFTIPQSIVGLTGIETVTDNGFYIRTVAAPTEIGDSGTIALLGDNVDFLNEWESHYSEIWIKASGLETYLSASAQLTFNSDYFTVTGVEFGEFFTDGLYVTDEAAGTVSMSALTDSAGVTADGLILLARVSYVSGEGQGVAWEDSFEPVSLEWELTAASLFTDGGSADVSLGLRQIVELWGNPYDTDDSGRISSDDFINFALAYGQSFLSDDLYNIRSDYDRDGRVSSDDFINFACMYGVTKEMVASGARDIYFPKSFTQRYIGTTLGADSQEQVGMVFDAASDAWVEALGLDDAISVTIVVKADLSGDSIAMAQVTDVDENGAAAAGIIYLDDDAAGNLWYSQLSDPVDASRYDLYTVLLHELGHLYGYDASSEVYLAAMDQYGYLAADGHSTVSTDVMYYGIEVGERKELTENDIAAASTILAALTGETAGDGSAVAIIGLGSEGLAPVLDDAGVALEGEAFETVAATQMSDTPLEAPAVWIESKTNRSLADSGLEIENLVVFDQEAPLLVRDKILEESFTDEENGADWDDLSFAEEEASDWTVSTDLDAWFEGGDLN